MPDDMIRSVGDPQLKESGAAARRDATRLVKERVRALTIRVPAQRARRAAAGHCGHGAKDIDGAHLVVHCVCDENRNARHEDVV
jgi:hypothetical protein